MNKSVGYNVGGTNSCTLIAYYGQNERAHRFNSGGSVDIPVGEPFVRFGMSEQDFTVAGFEQFIDGLSRALADIKANVYTPEGSRLTPREVEVISR